ncbi:class I SAM-dependent methyltransferase [Pseudonocardia sp. CA-107938]|uniref:class I SAM-dependent methyltransferase n=1 Tax=Pseudonocardia sp. CA-107938 TaxID=3240021 RepID=UPI003D900AE7
MDTWAGADAYERYIGRWSAPVAARFVVWLDVPPGRRWLDVGCGTGALTRAVLDAGAPEGVTGVEPSAAFVEHARRVLADRPARFTTGDARDLPLPDGSVDAVVSGLVLNFVPEPAAALAEAVRVVAPGGTVAAYVWDYAEGMQLIRWFWDAAVALDPAAADLDEGACFPLCHPEPLRDLWTAAGLADVTVAPIVIDTPFADFDDYWTPFLGAVGPAPAYLAKQPADRQAELRERLRTRAGAGPLQLTARAWAVRGRA